jgi:hypothetical protein
MEMYLVYVHNVEKIDIKPFGGTIPSSHQIIFSYKDGEISKQVTLCMDEFMIKNLISELNKFKPSFEHPNPIDYVK